MNWSLSLAYFISPRSGPMRRMETLLHANHALSQDLPFRILARPHWTRAGQLLVAAAETGTASDIHAATDALYYAIEAEGWMAKPLALKDGTGETTAPPGTADQP